MPGPLTTAAIAAAIILCVAAAGRYVYNRWIRPIYFSDDELAKYRRLPIANNPHEQMDGTSNVAETRESHASHSYRASDYSENHPLLIAEPTTSVDFGEFFRGQYNPGTLLNPIVTRIRNHINRRGPQQPREQPRQQPRTPTDSRTTTVRSAIEDKHDCDSVYNSDNSSFNSDDSFVPSSPSGAQPILNVSEDIEIMNSEIISIAEQNERRLQTVMQKSALLGRLEQQLEDRRRSIMRSLHEEDLLSSTIIDNVNKSTDESNDNVDNDAELESASEDALFSDGNRLVSSSADEVVSDSTPEFNEQSTTEPASDNGIPSSLSSTTESINIIDQEISSNIHLHSLNQTSSYDTDGSAGIIEDQVDNTDMASDDSWSELGE